MVKRTLLALGLLACIASVAMAVEPTTTINGTLTDPFGSTSTAGTVSCELSDSGTWDNGGTPAAVTTPVAGTISGGGVVSLVLTPNDLITPAGTYWVCDWIESGVAKWRDQPIVPSDPDPIEINAVPRMELPKDGGLDVWGPLKNRSSDIYEFQFDSNGDTLWDAALYDDGTQTGLILRNGLPFIQFGVGAKLKIKLCGVSLDAGFFYDEDDDGTYDATDDFCWGLGGYDYDCNCVADSGGSSPGGFALDGTANWYTFNADEDGTSDLALFDPRLVDSNGDGTLDMDITAGGLGGLHGDATYAQRFAIFPGGYSSDPFDYASGFVAENDSASGIGAFYPVVSDPNYATLGAGARSDLGTSTYKWRDAYFSGTLNIATTQLGANALSGAPAADGEYQIRGTGKIGLMADSDNDATGTRQVVLNAKGGTSPTNPQFTLDGSANTLAVDTDADGTPDIRFDGDEPVHGESLTWDGTASAARWAAGGSGDVTDVFNCASGDCQSITVADGDKLDFSAVNNSATTEGLIVPQATSVLTGTATGQVGYDTDGNTLYVGGAFHGLQLAVPVTVEGDEYINLFAEMLGTVAASGLAPYSGIEGTPAVVSVADANPQTSSTAIGVIRIPTGTTAGNEASMGTGVSANTTTQTFEPKKLRLFGARGYSESQTVQATRALLVGGVRTSSDGNPATKTDGIFFWCNPAADLDNDGTVGDIDTDGTGTTAPDGDCADAGEDADDCNWYAVTMNNATDNAKISTATNTTATKTTTNCSNVTTLQQLEIAYDGSTVNFYIDGASAASISTNIPADGRRLWNWGVYVDQNIAAAKSWTVDWMRYYGIR